MRVLRLVGLVLAFCVVAVIVLRAAVILVGVPYALWRLFRESGYPWWIQVPGALALIAGFVYLLKASAATKPPSAVA